MFKKERFHRIIGHVNFQDLSKMCREQILEGLPQHSETGFINCKTCLTCKMTRKTFNSNRYRAKDILEIIYTYVKGSFDIDGLMDQSISLYS